MQAQLTGHGRWVRACWCGGVQVLCLFTDEFDWQDFHADFVPGLTRPTPRLRPSPPLSSPPASGAAATVANFPSLPSLALRPAAPLACAPPPTPAAQERVQHERA